MPYKEGSKSVFIFRKRKGVIYLSNKPNSFVISVGFVQPGAY